jgi:hypothetical protein
MGGWVIVVSGDGIWWFVLMRAWCAIPFFVFVFAFFSCE